jgi:aminoglycoside 3-N-acetyltransferase
LFGDIPIEKGGALLFHSSAVRTLRRNKVKPNDIIHSLLDKLGPNGTLLLPLFNFDFTTGIPFDIRTTPSQMGALTEAGRKWPGAVRTGHPIYSFAVIGQRANEFEGMDNKTAYGADSPFAKLRAMDGQIGVLDLPDQNAMTFYHHVEEMMAVPYRYQKAFTAPYTDLHGNCDERTYWIFVRDLKRGVKTSVDRMGERLWARGVYKGDRPKVASGMRVIDSNRLYEEVAHVIEAGEAENYLFEFDK